MYNPKKYVSANQRNQLLKEPIQLQLLVEPDQSSMAYKLSINCV